MHPYQNILQQKMNQKTKAKFGRCLWPPAWKQNKHILEELHR